MRSFNIGSSADIFLFSDRKLSIDAFKIPHEAITDLSAGYDICKLLK